MLSSEVLNNTAVEIMFLGSDEDIDLLTGGWRRYIQIFVEHDANYKFVADGRMQIYDHTFQLETNSPLAQIYYQLNALSFKKSRKHREIADDFEKILATLNTSDTLLYRKYDDSVSYHRQLQSSSFANANKVVIKKNPNSYLSLYLLSEATDLALDEDFYIKIDKQLSGKFRETPQAKKFIKALAKIRTDLPIKLTLDANSVADKPFNFENFKDKNGIVIDFWATWCASCLEVMPKALAVEKQLKAKNIVYVFLSYDERIKTWKGESDRLGLQHSYRIAHNAKPYLKETLHLESIPRYILINNRGDVLLRDLPSPNDPKFLVTIDSVMNKLDKLK
ncbi:TlpA family protein disulfide reductase [Pedobacter namyangjuensis]|uniref:TlpA family protein disulfide reductase n=1 Tax=Pedobacter namyangjuensis TaxID=600626 RepID=UPI0013B39D64|nr:TlpA disulfide reductase family protein [Pedobacter namyangjuensis]